MNNQLKPKVDQFKLQLNAHKNNIVNYLGEEKLLKFMSSVSYVVEQTPKLLEVNRDTLLTAMLSAAELQLYPGASGEVYILPYKNKAQFILGYQGLVTLLYKAGVSSIDGEIVKEKDTTKLIKGTGGKSELLHEIPIGARGKPVGAYVIVKMNGEEIWKYMNEEEILKFKEFSQSKNSDYSPWKDSNDPNKNMWLKTVLRQVAKLLPKNPDIVKALAKDNEDGDIKKFADQEAKKKVTSFAGAADTFKKEAGSLAAPKKDKKEEKEKDDFEAAVKEYKKVTGLDPHQNDTTETLKTKTQNFKNKVNENNKNHVQ